MESHSRLRLLVLLCLVFSIAGARPLLPPDVSPTVDPAAWSRLLRTSDQETLPRLSPALEPAPSSRLSPDASPTAGPGGPFLWPFKSEDFSFDDIGLLVVADSPSESAAMNQAAAVVAEIDGPSANDAAGEPETLVTELDIFLSPSESVGNELSPEAAVAMNEAASVAAELDMPPINQMIDVGAALDSLDETTSKSLPFLGS